jgi:hypothetical protein
MNLNLPVLFAQSIAGLLLIPVGAALFLYVVIVGLLFSLRRERDFSWRRFREDVGAATCVALLIGGVAFKFADWATSVGSGWYGRDWEEEFGWVAGIMAYPLAAAAIARRPKMRSVLEARWWRRSLLVALALFVLILAEVARPRTDFELLAALGRHTSSYYRGKRGAAVAILVKRGQRAAHLAPQVRKAIEADWEEGYVPELAALAAVNPSRATAEMLVERANKTGDILIYDLLGRMGEPARPVAPKMLDALVLDRYYPSDSRIVAARAIASLDAKLVADPRYQAYLDHVAAGLESESLVTRINAASQLGRIGPGAAAKAPLLEKLVAQDRDCRRAAIEALEYVR